MPKLYQTIIATLLLSATATISNAQQASPLETLKQLLNNASKKSATQMTSQPERPTQAQTTDSNCTSISIKSTANISNIHAGDLWCSSKVLEFNVPGFVFSELQHIEPIRFGMQKAPLGKHIAEAINYIKSNKYNTPYVGTTINLAATELPVEFNHIKLKLLFRAGNYETPEVLVKEVEQSTCPIDSNGIEIGSALRSEFEKKFGTPASFLTASQTLEAHRKIYENSVRIYNEKVKEDIRYKQVLAASLQEETSKYEISQRQARETPNQTVQINWKFPDGATVQASTEHKAACQNGQFEVRLILNGTDLLERALAGSSIGNKKPNTQKDNSPSQSHEK